MKNPARFVLVNSPVQADILFRPAVIYQLKRHGKVVLELWFYPFERRLEAILVKLAKRLLLEKAPA